MRLLLLWIVIAAGLAGYLWFNQRDPDQERARLAVQAQVAAARIGVQKMLRESETFDFSHTVISRNADADGFEFRAMLVRQGAPRPVYGVARTTCDQALDTSACWQISELVVDGREYVVASTNPDAPDNVASPASEATEQPQSLELPRSGGNSTSPPSPESSPESNPAQPAAVEQTIPSTPAGPSPTHQVDRPVVNARSGPGTNNPVVTRLSGGTNLAQVGEADGWGQFMVLSGEAEGEIVWIALSIVVQTGS